MKFLSFFTGFFKSTTIEKVSEDVKEVTIKKFDVKLLLLALAIISMVILALVHGDRVVIAQTIKDIFTIGTALSQQ